MQSSRVLVISRAVFMVFLISGTALGETPQIVLSVSAQVSPATAAPDDIVGQGIQAALEPLISSFPPLITSRKHQRADINRVVLDFYSHRNYRAAWTDGRDITQLLKSLNDIQADGLNPADFRGDELAELNRFCRPSRRRQRKRRLLTSR